MVEAISGSNVRHVDIDIERIDIERTPACRSRRTRVRRASTSSIVANARDHFGAFTCATTLAFFASY
jgi:hypothetical protein